MMLTGKVATREYRLEVCLRALLEYAEWMESETGRFPALSVMAARGELGIDPERRDLRSTPDYIDKDGHGRVLPPVPPRSAPDRETAMERLLMRAAEELHIGCRGIQLGRNAWELLNEIEFYLGAREEDARAARSAPDPLPRAPESKNP